MQIYVVRPGDSVYNIARSFNISPQELIQANQLPQPDRLVVGQALVVPIAWNYYYVQRGDSLYSIARRFNMDYVTLAAINGLNVNAVLYPNQRLYIPPRPKATAVSNAYFEPLGGAPSDALIADAENAAPLLTFIAPFSYRAGRDGTLLPPPFGTLPEIAQDTTSLMMVVTNIEDGQFSAELASDILNSAAVQDLLIDNIIAEADRAGIYTDIHFDFEYMPAALRDAYTAFIGRAALRLHEAGYDISVALAPKTSAGQQGQWYEAHDYRALGSIVDFVVIMTYEWGYSGGPPMAVSPINQVERVLNYALTEMPAEKILMGQNLYGYDWTLPFVPGGQYARAVSPQQAINIARDNNAAILYDYTAQAPYFNYTADGRRHTVWFEDARSIQAKFDLIKRLNLRGISYWKLGLPFPQNWLLLEDNFNIIKY